MTNFAPTIQIDGQTVTPKGYMWVLGFALAGCDWAIKEASKPEFLKTVRAGLEQEAIKRLEAEIARYESKLLKLKEELRTNHAE